MSIGSDNGLLPGGRQTIIWTSAAILLIGPLQTNCGEILIEMQTFSLKKIRLKMSSAKYRPFCLSLDVLKVEETLHIRDSQAHFYYKQNWKYRYTYYTTTYQCPTNLGPHIIHACG